MERESGLRHLSSVSFLKRELIAPPPQPCSRVVATAPPAERPRASKPLQRSTAAPLLSAGFSLRGVAHSVLASDAFSGRAELFSSAEKQPPGVGEVLSKAAKRALGGGVPGMVAMVIQVFALMWMRTTINYQYRHGGIPRFYRGLLPALVQGPLSRFGDTAANAGMLALLDSYDATAALPIWIKTLTASGAAAGFRIVLMPVDALKTTLQVEGAKGLSVLGTKVRTGGPLTLWHGALAASGATFVGHYPWFVTRNYMEDLIPTFDDLPRTLLRAALIGFVSSAVSDTCSNSIRVIKTTKQTHPENLSYPQALQLVLKKDGVTGLLFRGLGTKILSNGMQGLMFNVLWRLGMDAWDKMEKDRAKS